MEDQNGAVVRLLTEIRDAQREESAYRKRVMDESLRLQRGAILTQRVALGVVVLLALLAGIGIMLMTNR